MINIRTIQKRASIIFQLIDDFTEKIVTTAQITDCAGIYYCINKHNGYYVFINMGKKKYQFTIKALNYLTVEWEADLATEQEPLIVKIRLQHGVTSTLLHNQTRIYGSLLNENQQPWSGKEIKLAVVNKVNNVRLMEDAQKNTNIIKLYSKSKDLLEGKYFFIGEQESPEFIYIQTYDEENDCLILAKPLAQDYPIGSIIYHSWKLTTDKKGDFILPIPISFLADDKTIELCIFVDNIVQKKKMLLQIGESNRLSIVINNKE